MASFGLLLIGVFGYYASQANVCKQFPKKCNSRPVIIEAKKLILPLVQSESSYDGLAMLLRPTALPWFANQWNGSRPTAGSATLTLLSAELLLLQCGNSHATKRILRQRMRRIQASRKTVARAWRILQRPW